MLLDVGHRSQKSFMGNLRNCDIPEQWIIVFQCEVCVLVYVTYVYAYAWVACVFPPFSPTSFLTKVIRRILRGGGQVTGEEFFFSGKINTQGIHTFSIVSEIQLCLCIRN